MSGGHDEFSHPNLLTNIIAVIGFVILILVVLWGLFHLLVLVRGWLATGFTGASRAALSLTIPRSVQPDTPFPVSWKFAQSTAGDFSLQPQCDTGVSVFFMNQQQVPCGQPTVLPGATSTVVISVKSQNPNATSTSPITVIFTPKSTTTAPIRVSAILTVVPKATTTPVVIVKEEPQVIPDTTITTEKPSTVTPSPTPATPKPQYTGRPDLQVTITGVGSIEPNTQRFVNRPPVTGGIAAVQFDIANVGGGMTGNYHFSAGLPTASNYVYNSDVQSPLAPGEHVSNTLRFTELNPGGGWATVTVDPFDEVRESNENNNLVSQSVGGYTYAPQPAYTQAPAQYYNQAPQYNQVYVPQQQPTYYAQPNTYQPQYDLYNSGYDQNQYNGDYFWDQYNYGW